MVDWMMSPCPPEKYLCPNSRGKGTLQKWLKQMLQDRETYMAYHMNLKDRETSLGKVRERRQKTMQERWKAWETLNLFWLAWKKEKGSHKPRNEGSLCKLAMAFTWRRVRKLGPQSYSNKDLNTANYWMSKEPKPLTQKFQKEIQPYRHLDFSSVRPMSDFWSTELWDNKVSLM